MTLNRFTPLRLFSHKTGGRNTVKQHQGRGNFTQLLEWITHWCLMPLEAEAHEARVLVGVVPDALIVHQLKKALPGLSVLTGDEAPGERKHLLSRLEGANPQRLVMSLREATRWLRQHPAQACGIWAWGQAVHQRLGHAKAFILSQAKGDTHFNGSTYSRFWYWGQSVPSEVQHGLMNTACHRLIWVTSGLKPIEENRVRQEVETRYAHLGEGCHIMRNQYALQPRNVEEAMAFLRHPQARVLCCDATVFSCLHLPQYDEESRALGYTLILESRLGKEGTHPEDVLNAYPWNSTRHFSQEWWRVGFANRKHRQACYQTKA
jgi:hypothetical protein